MRQLVFNQSNAIKAAWFFRNCQFTTNTTNMKVTAYYLLITIFISIQLITISNCSRWRKFYFDSATSPFYKNKEMLRNKFLNLINKGEEAKAMRFVKMVVQSEKAWRLQFCTRIFGNEHCSIDNVSPDPFFMWKRRMIHEVRQDPSSEIFNFFRSSLNYI